MTSEKKDLKLFLESLGDLSFQNMSYNVLDNDDNLYNSLLVT